MRKYKISLQRIVRSSFLIALLTFTLSYLSVTILKKDGFNFLELAFLPIISGVFFLITTVLINASHFNRFNREKVIEKYPDFRIIGKVLLSLTVSFLFYLAIDFIVFQIDKSISKEYAYTLKEMADMNGKNLGNIEAFAQLPFGLQNGTITFIFGLIGALLSLILIKPDGKLFQTRIA